MCVLALAGCSRSIAGDPAPVAPAGESAPEVPSVSLPPQPHTPEPTPCMDFDVIDDRIVYDPSAAPVAGPASDFAADRNHVYVATSASPASLAAGLYDLTVSGARARRLLLNTGTDEIGGFAASQDALFAVRMTAGKQTLTRVGKGTVPATELCSGADPIVIGAGRESRYFAYATGLVVHDTRGEAFRLERPPRKILTARDEVFALGPAEAGGLELLARPPVVGDPGRIVAAFPEGRSAGFVSDGDRIFGVEGPASAQRLFFLDASGDKHRLASLSRGDTPVLQAAVDEGSVYLVVPATPCAASGSCEPGVVVLRTDKSAGGDLREVARFTRDLGAERLFAVDECHVYFWSGNKLHMRSKSTLAR